MLNIIGSLMEGLSRLNEPILEENKGEHEVKSTVNYLTVPNVTDSEVFIASTTEYFSALIDITKVRLFSASENNDHKRTQLSNLDTSSEIPGTEDTLIKVPAVTHNGYRQFFTHKE